MLLQAEAEKLALTDLQKGVVTQIVTNSALFAMLPVRTVRGKSYTYLRENTLGVASWVGPSGKIKESAATYDEISTKLKACIGDADIPDMLEEFDGSEQSPTALQIRAKTKVVLREVQRIVVKGNSTTNPLEPNGLEALTIAGQTIYANSDAANGGPLIFKDIWRARSLLKVGSPTFMVANDRSVIAIRERYQERNTPTEDLALPNFGKGQKFLHVDGVPCLREDNIGIAETRGTKADCSSLYMVSTDEDEGFTGLISKKGAGIMVKSIGTLADKDAERIRVKMWFGTALRSTLAVVRIGGIRDVAVS